MLVFVLVSRSMWVPKPWRGGERKVQERFSAKLRHSAAYGKQRRA
jgi:hypothetical protein